MQPHCRKNPTLDLKLNKDFRNDTAGMVFTIMPPAGDTDSLLDDDIVLPARGDPVIPHNRAARRKTPPPPGEKPKPLEVLINPSLSTRVEYRKHYHPKNIRKPCEPLMPYEYPKTLKVPRLVEKERKKRQEKDRLAKCEYEILRMPSPTHLGQLSHFEMMSPEISHAKVMPARPSVQSGYLYPEPPTEDELELHKPKSGIFINVKEPPEESSDTGIPHRKKKHKKIAEDMMEDEWEDMYYGEDYYYEDGEEPWHLDKSTAMDEDQPLRMIRRTVSQSSKATSLNDKDFVYEDTSWEQIPVISQLVQTFREPKKKKKIKKGTLESHSYTRLKQKILDEFCFKVVLGSIHQGDDNFSTVSRNRQGICMAIAALCYVKLKKLKKPENWTEKTVDEIVEVGDMLFIDSISSLHVHNERKLKPREVINTCFVDEMKIKFEIDDPEVNGHIRSDDKRIYNITKGLKIFFHRHKRALLQTDVVSLAIWKKKKYFYIFDATPRRKDAFEDPNGKAAMICVQNLRSVVSVLLDRTTLANSPFLLSKVTITRVMRADEQEEASDKCSMYNILSDKKAVVQGTFDLGDKCFMFTRNKQALAMATTCLVYSRITSPATWRKKTIDKIMVIGNQLYAECAESENIVDQEMQLENLPAIFTIGPYIIEVFIYASCLADNMYKKSQCALEKALEMFFEKNTNAIIQIGKYTVAIWYQRNMFYYFDPYARNSEGLKCRTGAACVSMNCDLPTMMDTIKANFDDPDAIFYVHALKVIKIHRDPAMNKLFPKSQSLNDVPVDHFMRCRLKKSKKKAVEKPITTDFTEYAIKQLLAGDSPGPSFIDVASNIGSIEQQFMPPMLHKFPKKEVITSEVAQSNIADLDDPSLSETQLIPERPQPMKQEEEITLMDLDSFDLTQEELELQMDMEDEGLAEDEGFLYGQEAEEFQMGEGEEDYYLAKGEYSQVNSSSLESMHLRRSEVMNTDISYCYNILPAQEIPICSKRDPDRMIVIDEERQMLELSRETRFIDAEDGVQLIQGEKNITEFDENLDYLAPYICVMAIGYSNETPLYRWTKKTIDFILKSGTELYRSFEVSYDKVEDFHLEFQRYRMDITLESLLDTYVGSRIIESEFSDKALQALIENYLFTKSICGLVITKRYSCAIFFKRNLLYLFEVFGTDKEGRVQELGTTGPATLMRFRTLETLVMRILENRKARLPPEDEDVEYTRIILIKPNVEKIGDEKPEQVVLQKYYNDEGVLIEPEVTQSRELGKLSNFIDLPDGSQLIRGTMEIKSFGQDVDLIAPYVCIMAAAVGGKYSVSTWSPDIVNYVLQCGAELYQKSKYQFLDVAKLEIPRVALGRTDFSLEVNYRFDAPLKDRIIECALLKILQQNGEWAIVVSQEYACATYYKNGLYYLYDGYPSNEVGLSEGPFTAGLASFSRFTDLHSMITRILYNKHKREQKEKLSYSRFVLSTCRVRYLQPELEHPKARRPKRKQPEDDQAMYYDEQEGFVEEEEEEEGDQGAEEKPQNLVGFQKRDAWWVIEGTKSMEGRTGITGQLKEDHFICICACLLVIGCPIKKWDTRKVNRVIDQGKHIFSHAENRDYSDKRTIKNILMGKYFFDIIVRPIKINDYKKNRNVLMGLRTIFGKRKFCIIQLPNCCVVIYKEEDVYYFFDPYSWTYKNKDKERQKVEGGWILYGSERRLVKKLKAIMVKSGEGQYAFYTFEVISVRKAPRKVLMSHKLQQYVVDKPKKTEAMGKPFHEQEGWLNIHQNPWSRIKEQTASGKLRGSRDAKWHNWDIEYSNDLYSLIGNLHTTSKKFPSRNRGKQTLCNLVVSIAMTNIYELTEWSPVILDSVLQNGDHYFTECIKDIKDENYELSMDDLLEDCSIFPYNFKVAYTPSIEGTMFLTHRTKFNLYKALRYFFENYESRCGIIIAIKGENKRLACFGKTQENEYFMYDCQAFGPPMFYERQGAGYILRAVTLARLLHCLVLTLKGGDFYIYDVETFDFEPMKLDQ